MVWPIIAILCEVNEDDAALEDYDDNDIDEIVDKYKNVINNNSECFEFVTKVLSDFNDFQAELPSKERVKMFIDESWHSYDDYFDIKSATPAIKEIVIRLTLYNILRKRSVIATIKGKVKL